MAIETSRSSEEKKFVPKSPTGVGVEPRLIEGRHTYETITAKISQIVLTNRPPLPWLIAFGMAFLLVNVLLVTIVYLLATGIGIFGNNIPVAWGFPIINFVWWIGIGHAGTLISAILLLLRQQWRNSINRFAEAMTLFAVVCAGLYPLLHTGRPWLAYWMFPYPNVLGMWPQFRSPLIWDVFAVSTYATVSILFWFVGLIPDLASLRDRAKNPISRFLFGMLAMGWRGSARHWFRYEVAYLILAALSTPLVLSVHTIVSFDFAVSNLPGWHATIFPPYFVAGAVFAGFAMVLTLGIPLRELYGLKDFITDKHLDWMAKILLTTGMIVVYGYAMEMFFGWYSGNVFEKYVVSNRLHGPYNWSYFLLLLCNGIIPQLFWVPAFRRKKFTLLFVAWSVNLGMWLERFVIIPISLHRDYLPSSWGYYVPTFWDFSMFAGTMGLFVFLIMLFVKFLPMINIFEMRDLLHRMNHPQHPGVGHEEHGMVPATVGSSASGEIRTDHGSRGDGHGAR